MGESLEFEEAAIAGGITISEPGIAFSDSLLDQAADVESDSIHPIENNEGNSYLDQKVYAGRWWEIASHPLNDKDQWERIPNKYYKHEAGNPYINVSYNYIWMRNDQYFKVTCTNYLSSNNYSRDGILSITDEKNPRQMILKYNDDPENYIRYDIIATDYNDYSIVKIRYDSYSEDEYRIIILSRKKFIRKNEARALIEYINELGYDGDTLEASPSVIL